MKIKKAVVFIDGASRGNPGPASVGVVLLEEDGKLIREFGAKIGVTTNNVAEYSALLTALQEALMLGIPNLEVRTDSELLAKQFSGEYKVKDPNLKVLFFLATHLKKGFKSLNVSHVPREENKKADACANRALDDEFFL